MRRVFFVLVLAILANVCGLSGQESIPVDSVHFPDARFREYVMANFDADANGILESSELDAVDSIDFGDGHWIYTSLEGIEHFWNLKYLDCGLQELTSLDVTRNAELRYLHCAANDLTVLDVSRNTKLKRLTCWGCLLETLDLSHNDSLEYLNCMEPLNDGTLKSIILPSYSKKLFEISYNPEKVEFSGTGFRILLAHRGLFRVLVERCSMRVYQNRHLKSPSGGVSE